MRTRWYWPPGVLGAALLLLLVGGHLGRDALAQSATAVLAAGTVGTGTPASCSEAALDAALAGGSLVTFNCGGRATITVTSTKTITQTTTIDGGGLVTISGGGSGKLEVGSGARVAIQNLTLTDGRWTNGGILTNRGTLYVSDSVFANNEALDIPSGGNGGAIDNQGTLIITDTVFSQNVALAAGGAINNRGALTLTRSVFSNNRASGGGGVSNQSGGRATVQDTLFSRNVAQGPGGGIHNNFGAILGVNGGLFSSNTAGFPGGAGINSGGELTVTNTTFSGNSTSGPDGASGGGIRSSGATLTAVNSTFTSNGAAAPGFGGAIAHSGGLGLLQNTIVANSTAGGNCSGQMRDGGHNLDSGATCGLSAANGSLSNADPKLRPLQNNGGSTQTHALLPGSPAIDAGDNATCPATDQRGAQRPADGDENGSASCDVGAFEAGARLPTPTPTMTTTPSPTGTSTPTVTPTGVAGLQKSDTNPGIRAGAITAAGVTTTTVAAGQTFTLTARYVDDRLAAGTDDAEIRRAFVLLHQSDTNEWLYLYVERSGGGTTPFTGWAYSPYPETARGANAANPRSQRLTSDGALALGSAVAPTAADAEASLTRRRLGATVHSVRVSVPNGQLQVEWQLVWGTSPTGEDFPAGPVNVLGWTQTTTAYDGWDQIGSVRLTR